MSKSSVKTVQRALNRLSVACHDEMLTLEAAALRFGGERGSRLRQQASRRAVFVRDIQAGVLALGGVPATGPSYGAKLTVLLRSLSALVMHPQKRTAYVSCTRMTARTAHAYARVLDLELPADVRFGLGQQQAEIDVDSQELRWLRWGGSLSQSSGVSPVLLPAL
jgi:hypothetical protein